MSESTFTQVLDNPTALVAVVKCEKVATREAQVIETELRNAGPARKWRVVIDLSQVTMLASVGLGMLVTMHKQCSQQGGRMAVCGLNAELQTLLKLTHLDRVIKVLPDQPAAIKAVS